MPDVHLKAILRAEVAARAQRCCEYCRAQEKFSPDSFSIEHITPVSGGGSSESDNLANSCQGCNNRKYVSVGAVDTLTGELVALYHPRQQQWSDHVAWNEDFTVVIGLTPTGRATVEKLHLNRRGLVNLRRVLFELHEHPPK